jgi:enolase
MPTICAIKCRRVLNSHVDFTNEFMVELDDGSSGAGGSPQGETISIYEDGKVSITPEDIVRTVEQDGCLGRVLDQAGFDDYLLTRLGRFGRNNTYALSLAFFNATRNRRTLFDLFGLPEARLHLPRICCNILNGGWHAYTNPVLSDFHEYLLVSKSNKLEEVIRQHNEIQRVVRERLIKQAKIVVAGNPVSRFATADNREAIDFLLKVSGDLGLSEDFDLMIDASASDLRADGGYRFPLTDGLMRSSEELCKYWTDLIRQYNLRFLEDPFAEKDPESWRRLTTSQQTCCIIGDNFYSSDAERIQQGAIQRYSHGVIIKPNQAGTVSAVRRAVEIARQAGQIVITSHRSISTEETFLSLLTCVYGAECVKIGPLMTDYSSIVRLNEIIRLTEDS